MLLIWPTFYYAAVYLRGNTVNIVFSTSVVFFLDCPVHSAVLYPPWTQKLDGSGWSCFGFGWIRFEVSHRAFIAQLSKR